MRSMPSSSHPRRRPARLCRYRGCRAMCGWRSKRSRCEPSKSFGLTHPGFFLFVCSFSLWGEKDATKDEKVRPAMSKTIVVLEGDQTGQELLEESLRVLDPSVTGVEVGLRRFDLSLEQRRATKNEVVREAADAMLAAGLGLKAATITPEMKGDVGSPNAILRERVDGTVIVRTGRRIPGVRPVGGVHAPISVIRMAVGDAYGAKEWREGDGLDEVAFRTERITRRHCRAVAEFAFLHAERMGAKVFRGPKYTVSPIYEGMLKEEMDEAARRHSDIKYDPQLIDATYALLLSNMGDAMV